MRLKHLPDLLERQIDYPATAADVQERIGSTAVDAPDDEDSRTLAELLDHVDSAVYGSPEELHDAIVSALPDAYVGRKYYDDRGWNPVGPLASNRGDVDEQSF